MDSGESVDSSVRGSFGCAMVAAWEERMWLDRRELACPPAPRQNGVFGALHRWLRRARIRMQLGPVGGGWADGDPDKPM